jgi:hypothetical protein
MTSVIICDECDFTVLSTYINSGVNALSHRISTGHEEVKARTVQNTVDNTELVSYKGELQ